ncbi:MAG: O-antigen ligase C-terminal domain-containing protein [Magnetococcales bacterium]|nr:O-antigen ligase C-terminal domain-containing protein [Magnetococcales bacterium]
MAWLRRLTRRSSMVQSFLTRSFELLLILFFLVVIQLPIPGEGGGPIVPMASHLHWMILSIIILLGVLQVAWRGVLLISSFLKYVFLFIFSILLAAWFQPPVSMHAFVFQTAGLVGGLLFLVALHQFPLDEQPRKRLLAVILIAGVMQAAMALTQLQTEDEAGISGALVNKNILATFLATGLIIALLFLLRHSLGRGTIVLLFLAVALSLTTLILASSRAGLVGLVLGCTTLIIARWQAFHQVWKRVLAVWGMALVVALLAVSLSGQQKRVEEMTGKMADLPTFVAESVGGRDGNQYKVGRPLHFEAAWSLFLERPLWGQGVGGYSSRYRDLVRTRYPEVNLNTNDHAYQPYNELLRRLAESGIGAGVGLLLMAGWMLALLYRQGREEGGTLLALMMPIAFDLQVEGLFYDTVALWATLLVLVSLATAYKLTRVNLLHHGLRAGLATLGLGLFVGVSMFLFNTARAQWDMTRYLYLLRTTRVSRGELLQPALDNLYLRQMATRLFMDVRLRIALLRQDREVIGQFLQWSRKERALWPNHVMYLNESRALHAHGDHEAARSLLMEGLRLFPGQHELSLLQKELFSQSMIDY